jgi:hypothetical protein
MLFSGAGVVFVLGVVRFVSRSVRRRRKVSSNRRVDAATINGYLNWVCDEFRYLPQANEGGTLIELNEAYVGLRIYPGRPHELSRSAEREPVYGGRYVYPTSFADRDTAKYYLQQTLDTSLADILSKNASLVVLGDPGSGKTTMLQWLALHSARALNRRSDPPIPGRKRLPVYVRIADYVEFNHPKKPLPAIADFLGQGRWSGVSIYPGGDPRHGQTIPSEKIKKLILEYLEKGEALILLDGLDEVAFGERRPQVRAAIDQFLATFCTDGTGVLGNRVVITSRIVGYEAFPLMNANRVATLEAMSSADIRCFSLCRFNASEKNERVARHKTSAFLQQALDPSRQGLSELTRSPLLLGLLIDVFQKAQEQLPSLRAELYEIAILQRIEQRSKRQSARSLLLTIGALAFHIHESTSNGLLSHSEIEEFIASRALVEPSHENISELLVAVKGLLGEKGIDARGETQLGFSHQTFQEFLAAVYLLHDLAAAPALFLAHAGDPRWREVLQLALGYASLRCTKSQFRKLLEDILNLEGRDGDQDPYGAIVISSVLSEIRGMPFEVIEAALRTLIERYGRISAWEMEGLSDHVENVFKMLFGSGRADTSAAEIVLAQALRSHDWCLMESSARIIVRAQIFSPEIARALVDATQKDKAESQWPIHNALVDLLSAAAVDGATRPAGIDPFVTNALVDVEALTAFRRLGVKMGSVSLPIPAAVHEQPLPSLLGPQSLRSRLEADSDLTTRLCRDTEWLSLVIALYGGMANFRVPELQQAVSSAQGRMGAKVEGTAYRQYAIQLDTGLGPRLARLRRVVPYFSPKHIYRESPLTGMLFSTLQSGTPAASLKDKLWNKWNTPSMPAGERADALVALAALGAMDTSEVLTNLPENGRAVLEAAESHINWLCENLRDPVARATPVVSSIISRASHLSSGEYTRLVGAAASISLDIGGQHFDPLPALKAAPAECLTELLAEYWARLFSGTVADVQSQVALALDSWSSNPKADIKTTIESLALVHRARNNKGPLTQWWMPSNSRRIGAPGHERLLDGLMELAAVPPQFEFFLYWLVGWWAEVKEPELHRYAPLVRSLIVTPVSGNLIFNQIELDLAPEWKRADSMTRFKDSVRDIERLKTPEDRFCGFYLLAARAPQYAEMVLPRITETMQETTNNFRDNIARDRLQFLIPNSTQLEFPAKLQDQDADRLADILSTCYLSGITDAERAAWCTFVLAARFHDIKSVIAQRETEPTDLRRLVSSSESTVMARFLEAHGEHGLPLTLSTLHAIEKLHEQGRDADTLAVLQTCRGRLSHQLVPIVMNWLNGVPNNKKLYAGLWLAESGRWSPSVIKTLAVALDSDDCLARCWAALVLNGRTCEEHDRLKASQLGNETLEAIADITSNDLRPNISLSFAWAFERLLFDSAEMVLSWADQIESNSFEVGSAVYLLGNICCATPEVETVIESLMQRDNVRIKRAVLRSVFLLSRNQRQKEGSIPARYLDAIRQVAAHPSSDISAEAVIMLGYGSRLCDESKFLVEILQNVDLRPAVFRAVGRLMARAIEDQNEEPEIKKWNSLVRGHLRDPNPATADAAAEALARSESNTDVLMAALGSEQRVFNALVSAVDEHFVNPHFYAAIQRAADFLEHCCNKHQGKEPTRNLITQFLIAPLSERLRTLTVEKRKTDLIFRFELNDWLSVGAAIAERMPDSLAAAARQPRFLELLATASYSIRGFYGRRSALVILGYLHDVGRPTIGALQHAVRDVFPVASAGQDIVARLWRVTADAISPLVDMLAGEDAVAAYLACRLMVNIANNRALPSDHRTEIRSIVRKALERASLGRPKPVYMRIGSDAKSDPSRIVYIGLLHRLLRIALIEIQSPSNNGELLPARLPRFSFRFARLMVPSDSAKSGNLIELVVPDLSSGDNPVVYQKQWLASTSGTSISRTADCLLQYFSRASAAGNFSLIDLLISTLSDRKSEELQ